MLKTLTGSGKSFRKVLTIPNCWVVCPRHMKTKTYMVRVIGSEMGAAGWVEGLLLDEQDEFKNKRDAEAYAKRSVKENQVSKKVWAERFEILSGNAVV